MIATFACITKSLKETLIKSILKRIQHYMATGFQNLSKQKIFALKKCPQTKTEMEIPQNNFEIYILFIIWRSYSRKKEYATNFILFFVFVQGFAQRQMVSPMVSN
jgi:hypothetical protein